MLDSDCRDALRHATSAAEVPHDHAPESYYQTVIFPQRLFLAPHYATLRRVLSQLAGVLILYKGSSPNTRTGVAISLEALREDLEEALDALRGCRSDLRSGGLTRACTFAAERLLAVLDLVSSSLSAGGGGFEAAVRALPQLQSTHQVLLRAADDEAGMGMVSYCGCCAGVALQTARAARS